MFLNYKKFYENSMGLPHLVCAALRIFFLFEKGVAAFFFCFLSVCISGCSIFVFSEKLLDFSPEENFHTAKKRLAFTGKAEFFFLLPGHRCEKKLPDAVIYIKAFSGNEIILQQEDNLKNLTFPYYGNTVICTPMGYFYKGRGRNMTFEIRPKHESIEIEIYCDCKEIPRMIVWLKDRDEKSLGTVRMHDYLKKIEAASKDQVIN